MVDFTIKEIINQPKDIVVKAFLNPENMLFWTKNLEKFEVVSGNPGEIGSIAILHYLENGKRYDMKDELIECEPKKRYVSKVTGEDLTAIVETILNDIGKDTEIIIHWSGKSNNLLTNSILTLMKKRMIYQTKNELKNFKNLVEKRGVHFNIFSHKTG
jgi:hypothetical protein